MRLIAGNPVQVRNEVVQRCVWCGEALVEQNVTRVAVKLGPDGAVDFGTSVWPLGHLIERSSGVSSDEGLAPEETDDWPAGCWT